MCLILFYNSFFGHPPSVSDLAAADQQAFTWDTSRFLEADAVVFHLPSLGPIKSLRKPAGQIWILTSQESVVHYRYMADPEFLKFFDLTMTYERSADVWFPYIPERQCWDDALRPPVPAKTELAPAAMFQSSFINRSGRIAYVAELMKHLKIDSFGRVLNNRTLSAGDTGSSTKLQTIGRYKFCISMENSICEDYVTEKFFQPLLAGTVPVYLGAPNVDAFAPGENCYVNVRDFSGPEKLAEYLLFLNENDAAYRRFFEWRQKPLRPSLQADIDRRGLPFANLLQATRARLQTASASSKEALELSFDPALSLPDFSNTVAPYIYPHAVPSGRFRWGHLPSALKRAWRSGKLPVRVARLLGASRK